MTETAGRARGGRDFFEVVRSQRACRAFLADPVSDADLELLLDAARFAPSAENAQPWVFVVVTEPGPRATIGELIRRAWEAGARQYEVGKLPEPLFDEVDRGATGGVAEAPVLIVVSVDTTATLEVALPSSVFPAVQNLLLAAGALGLGSALTTLATFHPDELRDLLALPDHVQPVAVVPIGHPARRLGPPRRRPLDEIAHRERYGAGWR